MKETLDFLRSLQRHNDRTWFNLHKDEYRAVKDRIDSLAAQLIDGIAGFDNSVVGLTPADCTYRIYRDTRFSNDKTPYKTHIGIYVCRGGKKSPYAGYYLHMEPDGNTPRHTLIAGLYCPGSKILHSVREEICYNGEEFEAAVRHASGFTIYRGNMLKRTPTGFPADTPCADYLRLRDVYLERSVDDAFLTADGLAERCTAEFARTFPFVTRLNMAVDYALEEP